MLPPSPPLISPPENLNYVVLITQFMTHFTRPKFMFQWISVSPPARFGFVRRNFSDLFSLTPNLLFGFPDNLFSNRICIPPLPIFAITRRGLVAAFIGGQAVAVTVWPPLGEINGRSGFVWFLRPHCLFWSVSSRPGDSRASTGECKAQVLNFTNSRKLNKTTFFCGSF